MSAWGNWSDRLQGWNLGGSLNDAQRDFYNETANGGQQAYFASLANHLAGGNANSTMAAYLRQQYGNLYSGYLTDQRAFQPDFYFTDYAKEKAPSLMSGYYGLTASQRGANPTAFARGREQW